jgi:hypothetical protein
MVVMRTQIDKHPWYAGSDARRPHQGFPRMAWWAMRRRAGLRLFRQVPYRAASEYVAKPSRARLTPVLPRRQTWRKRARKSEREAFRRAPPERWRSNASAQYHRPLVALRPSGSELQDELGRSEPIGGVHPPPRSLIRSSGNRRRRGGHTCHVRDGGREAPWPSRRMRAGYMNEDR